MGILWFLEYMLLLVAEEVEVDILSWESKLYDPEGMSKEESDVLETVVQEVLRSPCVAEAVGHEVREAELGCR